MNKEIDIIVPVCMARLGATCESVVKDILEPYHNYGVKRFVLTAPSGGWRSVGYPPKEHYLQLAEMFLEIKKIIAPYGIECGWWDTATLKSGPSDEFAPIIRENGEAHPFANCPLDKNFQKRFAENIALFAKIAKPAFIITEDDFSNMAAGGCFCEQHLKAFERKMGQYYSRERLHEILQQNKPEDFEIIRKWRENLKDSLVEIIEVVRTELDKESPEIPMGYCQAGSADMEGNCTEAIARAMAGSTHTPFVRFHGAAYGRISAKTIPAMLHNSLYHKQHIKGDFTFYHEADTYPHTRFYTSGAHMRTIMAITYAYGFDGSLFYIGQLLDERNEETAYGRMLVKEKARFNTVQQIAKQCTLKGVEISYDPFWSKVPLWLECVSRFGIPYVTARSNTVFWDDMKATYADHNTIMEYLSHNLFLDAGAAKVLCERGYGEYLGVEVGEKILNNSRLEYDLGAHEAICEPFTHEGKGRTMPSAHMYSPPGNGVQLKLTVTNESCEVVSELYTFQKDRVAPVMTRFKNKLGGKVVIMGITLDKNRSHSLINYRRMRLLQDLLIWCSDEYVFAKEAPDVYVIQNEVADYAESGFFGMLTLTNLCEDALDEISLHLPPAWKELTEFYILDGNGKWDLVDFCKNEEGIVIRKQLNYLDPMHILAK